MEAMKWKKALTVCWIAFLLVCVSTSASNDKQDSATPSFRDILSLKSPGRTLISPDGRWVLYTVSEAVWDKNEYRTQLWRADIESGRTLQLTHHEKSSSGADWSPDSQWISFASSRDGKRQLYVMSVRGGEARKVTDSKTGVGGYRWSPDAKSIAYTASDEKPKQDEAIEKKYGKFEVIEEEFDVRHLWLVDVESGQARKLMEDADKHVTSFRWSPDGSQIAFSAYPNSLTKSFSKADLFVLDVQGGQVRKLVEREGADTYPVWSPDGKSIAFNSSGTETYFVNTEICTVPSQGGKWTCVTEAFDEDASLSEWKEDGIYFGAFQGMSYHLFRMNADGSAITPLTEGEEFRGRGFSLSADGSRMAFSFVSADHYPEVYWSESKHFEPRKLTGYSDQIKDWTLSSKERIDWKSSDGAQISGVLIKPANFDPAKKYPLFVIIHGGPTGISTPQRIDGYNRYYPIEQWAAKGALILEPNYRGSAGFGADFRKLNYRNLGVGDYWDVISGVDHLIEQGYVDESKVASMGWSQGGYITAFITTFSDRFAATSVGAGISDWVTYYYATDITPFTRHYLGATPWDDMEIYRKTSPMTYIDRAGTPTLIQHGEFDRRVPTPNAYKLYRGLKDKGVPVRLVIYKGFGHGINKPKEALAVLTHNHQWFSKYIWGEDVELEVEVDEDEKDDTGS